MRARLDPNRLILIATFLVLSSSSILWTLSDKTPPPWDPSDHLVSAYDYYQNIAHGRIDEFARDFFSAHHFYAPLVHVCSSLFFVAFGASRLSGIAVNVLSLALLLWSTEFIGRTLYSSSSRAAGVIRAGREPGENPSRSGTSGGGSSPAADSSFMLRAGTVAAVLVACYHFPAWLLHDAFLDYPLMAIVAASFALLIRANDFHVRRDAVIFGVAAGLGLLTKQTFAFFFVLPALYLVVRAAVAKDMRALGNLAIAGLIALGVAAIWYAPHLKDVIAIYRVNQRAAIDENEAPMFSFMSNTVYLHGLISMQVQCVFGIVFLAGLVYSIKWRRRESVMLYLWIASGIVAFTLIANKDMRYTVPILPAVALISVSWMGNGIKRSAELGTRNAEYWKNVRPILKPALSIALLIWAFVSFFNAQWPKPGMGTILDTPRFQWMIYARNYFGFDHRPLQSDWGVPEIVGAISCLNEGAAARNTAMGAAAAQPAGEHGQVRFEPSPVAHTPPTVGVVVNLPYLNPSNIALYSRLLAPGRAGLPLMRVNWLVTDASRDMISRNDYLVVRTGLEKADWVGPLEKEVQRMIESSPDRFAEVARFPIDMPGAFAVVYQRKHSNAEVSLPDAIQ
jgi:4-amino-4-deoxy-L-arabinose transferase-like glycosyltransferase